MQSSHTATPKLHTFSEKAHAFYQKLPNFFPTPRHFLSFIYARAIIYIRNRLSSRKFSRQTLCNLHIICTFAQKHEPSSHHERAKVVLPHRQSTESEALAQPPIRSNPSARKGFIRTRHAPTKKRGHRRTLFPQDPTENTGVSAPTSDKKEKTLSTRLKKPLVARSQPTTPRATFTRPTGKPQ